jgi:hypothetical protein
MKKNRLIVLGALALVLAVALSGCGKKEEKTAALILKSLEQGDAAAIEVALARADGAALEALTGNSASPGGDFSYGLNEAGDGIVITKYTGNGGTAVVPASIEGYPVVAIPAGRGYRDDPVSPLAPYGVTAVVLPAGITEIPDKAFWYCETLQTVILPDTVKSIGFLAFQGCTSLHTVNLPASLESIGGGAFYNCGELYNLSIPDSLTALEWGNSTFAGCGKLKIATRKRLQDLGHTGDF